MRCSPVFGDLPMSARVPPGAPKLESECAGVVLLQAPGLNESRWRDGMEEQMVRSFSNSFFLGHFCDQL